MNLLETAKFAVYRTPVINRVMAPKYPYKINPGQLAAMIGFIDNTRGAVCEVGVAQGDTSVFLLEHLATIGDARTLLLFDTFAGFTPASIEHEVRARNKNRSDFAAFRYGDEQRFRKNLHQLGYRQFDAIKGDAAAFDWASIAPIGAVLLDIDLYQPTAQILGKIWPHLEPGGGIVVDDCQPDAPWDGSLQAYEEFIAAHGLPFERVGRKGAIVKARPSP